MKKEYAKPEIDIVSVLLPYDLLDVSTERENAHVTLPSTGPGGIVMPGQQPKTSVTEPTTYDAAGYAYFDKVQ